MPGASCGAEWIMLDNMSIPQLRDVVARALKDHTQPRDPGVRLERLLRGVQHGGPHAFQRRTDLLYLAGGLDDQLFTAAGSTPPPARRHLRAHRRRAEARHRVRCGLPSVGSGRFGGGVGAAWDRG
ncbi:MAG: hypothetical protein DLM57_16935 [Pseudonocardiales bacterium]|nr:MAG: hypothetical protein DLM57_16935 [Pseudonocardiales bacterium]